MSQLSAEAEARYVNQAMMEGSRTGKATEADLMLLIAKVQSRILMKRGNYEDI